MTRRTLTPHIYRDVRTGNLRFRRRGWQSQVLRSRDVGPEFWAEYAAILRGTPAPPKGETFTALIASYRRSERFSSLAPRSKSDYDAHLSYFADKLGPRSPRKMERRDVVAMRESGMQPYLFNYRLRVLRVLMEHAIDLGWRADNPVKGVRELKGPRRERFPWPPEMVAAFRAEAGPRELLLFELLLGTGQRVGDVLKMQWGGYKDGAFHIRQGKTGVRLVIPATARLAALLDATPRRALTIITNAAGTGAWEYRTAAQMMLRVRKRIGAEAYDLHGLRHTAASELAALGLDDDTIAAVTGHTSRASVARYAGAARQKARAKKAQEKRDE